MGLIFLRAIVYATLFIGTLLVFVPARVLEEAGVTPPGTIGLPQVTGIVITTIGGLLALSCIMTFVFIGRGTPAPFDPPRRLVVRGPYRYVRNPMYIGAGLALLGAAIYYQSIALATYLAILAVVIQFFVVLYEEPTLRRTFGEDYEAYRRQVRRWWPRR